ncbi:protein of unknown function (plasmid) [Azospirillum baldaniorum]|uniref:HTH cro/C1-type domain-containing protein n=1 Tax=Azospirillum baldaniorum TaxID=1064539 RepID=A0A9P1JWN6_9PROT|nr:protein of unknown function [Azospirillum baldaniorum]
MSSDDDARHRLGAFLRAHRERLTPAEAGIPQTGSARRRTPGLRREEAAQLCGLSPTWYTWLEQGREVSVSPQALARIAGALRLTAAERAYLFELSRKRDPDADAKDGPDPRPATLLAALEVVAAPAYLLDRVWTAVGWNAPAAHLFSGWLGRGGAEPAALRLPRPHRAGFHRRLGGPRPPAARRIPRRHRPPRRGCGGDRSGRRPARGLAPLRPAVGGSGRSGAGGRHPRLHPSPGRDAGLRTSDVVPRRTIRLQAGDAAGAAGSVRRPPTFPDAPWTASRATPPKAMPSSQPMPCICSPRPSSPPTW